MSCRWQWPPSSHTGQSCGWLVIISAMIASRNSFDFGIVDRDARVVGRRRHARHHEAADLVVLVAIDLHRALPARADAAERRMPAEVGEVEAAAQARLQQIVCRVDFELLAVYVNDRHEVSQAVLAVGVCCSAAFCGASPASNSARKNFSADCNGSIAPGACGQNVLPGPSQRVSLAQHVDVFGDVRALLRAHCRIFTLHGKPSRHGVHQPHDSRAKNSSRLRTADTHALIVAQRP